MRAYDFSLFGYEQRRRYGNYPAVRQVIIVAVDKETAERLLVQQYKEHYVGYLFNKETECKDATIIACLPPQKLSLTGPVLRGFKFRGVKFGTNDF